MRITLFSASLLATGLAVAATPIDGWYNSIFGGYSYIPDNINRLTWDKLRNSSSYNGGYNAGARVGYSNNPFRYELEYTFIQAQANHFNINDIPQIGVHGRTQANLAMVNVYYDTAEVMPATTAFLGFGIGYALMQTSLNSKGPFDRTYFSVSENGFAYQGTAGLTYNFAENYALNLAYRYVATAESGNYGKIFQAHLADAGVIYHFDYGNYK